MALTILAIAAFQFYWLQKAYERERLGLERQTNMLFRETVRGLQASKLKLDRISDTSKGKIVVRTDEFTKGPRVRMQDSKIPGMLDAMMLRMKDSGSTALVYKNGPGKDSIRIFNKNFSGRRERLMQFLFEVDSLQDSIRINELQVAYAKRLDKENLDIPFFVSRVQTRETREPVFNEMTVGFQSPITYRLNLGSTTGFLLKRISVPILFSIFLVGFTLL